MAFSMAGGGPSGPQINVTPLIDVLLTLIIVFMLVVSQQKREELGEEAQIPQPDKKEAAETSQSRTIVLQVEWNGQNQTPVLKINQEVVKREDLEMRLAQIFVPRAEKVAFVRSDNDVDFEYVADVIDVARRAGVQRVGLLTTGRKMEGE
jgi:biopolymer transport protein TolR